MIQILGRCEQIRIKKLSKFNNTILDVFLQPDTLNLFWAKNLFWGNFSKIEILIENVVKSINENFTIIKNSYEQKLIS